MQVQFPGPSGSLEGEIIEALDADGSFAVLCHPHPQYGGNMDDEVLDICSQVFVQHGVSVLKFNFRGVGASDGSYSGGHAETEDLLAAVDWLRQAHSPESLWLGGYSFGFKELLLGEQLLGLTQQVINLPRGGCGRHR